MSLIRPYLYGWDAFEPILLACIASKQSPLLIGRHGIGKSQFMHFVGEALSNGKPDFNVHKYSMDKENLISMVGIPNVEALKLGHIEYSTHERSILNADVALLDEITRASKENQNMVLEILEEGTVFGKPLHRLQFIIATANDETYRGAMKLDAALLDRFSCVIQIPDCMLKDQARWGADELEEMIRLCSGDREKNLDKAKKDLKDALDSIRQTIQDLWVQQNKDGVTEIANNVFEFSAKFMAEVINSCVELNKSKKSDKFYISNRQFAKQFPTMIMATAAYFKVIKDDPEYLKSGAWEAVKYTLSTKLGLPMDKLLPIFENLKDLLTDGDALVGKVKICLTTGPVSQRIDTMEKYSDIIKANLELDETINSIGNMLQELNLTKEEDPEKKNLRDVIRLHDVLVGENLPENCLYAAKMKLWRYASDPNTPMLPNVMGW